MEKKYSISFVLPMFNESDNIERTICMLEDLAGKIADDYEIVIVDDASTDTSASIVEGISGEDSTVKLLRMDKNTKFGGAFAKGFKNASKDIILYVDSDLPVGEEDIKESLPLIEEADIVTGYSKVKKGDTLKRKVISGVYNFIVEVLFSLRVKDINSGYKVVKRSLIEDLDFISHSPFVDVELFLHAKKRGARIKQYPLIFNERTAGKSYISSIPMIWATFTDMIKVKFHSSKGS